MYSKLAANFILKIYKTVNYKRPKVFLYTDSRGFNITMKNYCRKIFNFYPYYFMKHYNVDLFLCPEKHTTIIDFLRAYESTSKKYDIVIAHVGIVDFSPRHQSVAQNKIYAIKKEWYDNIFSEKEMLKYLNTDLGYEYENEKTINMFSLSMAHQHLIPHLIKIQNLIWIGCNRFVQGWEGNYFRKRPGNISLVEEYSNLFCKELPNSVDLSDWSEDEIKKYTYDNIHLTKQGGTILLTRTLSLMKNLGG